MFLSKTWIRGSKLDLPVKIWICLSKHIFLSKNGFLHAKKWICLSQLVKIQHLGVQERWAGRAGQSGQVGKFGRPNYRAASRQKDGKQIGAWGEWGNFINMLVNLEPECTNPRATHAIHPTPPLRLSQNQKKPKSKNAKDCCIKASQSLSSVNTDPKRRTSTLAHLSGDFTPNETKNAQMNGKSWICDYESPDIRNKPPNYQRGRTAIARG